MTDIQINFMVISIEVRTMETYTKQELIKEITRRIKRIHFWEFGVKQEYIDRITSVINGAKSEEFYILKKSNSKKSIKYWEMLFDRGEQREMLALAIGRKPSSNMFALSDKIFGWKDANFIGSKTIPKFKKDYIGLLNAVFDRNTVLAVEKFDI